MLKPQMFQKPYVAVRHVPYICGDGSNKTDSASGGVLGRGQTVWTEETFDMRRARERAIAFVEEIGVISLDPRGLVSADVLEH